MTTKQKAEPKAIPDRESLEINEAAVVAKFFGFKPISPPSITKSDLDLVKHFDQSSHPSEKAALLRMYHEEKMMAPAQPIMLYCERPFPGLKDSASRKNPSKLESSLITMGSLKSVCECLSIQAGLSILNALGYKNLEVRVNSIGDKDSINEFQKKLSLFVKKNFNSFPADLRQALKKDMFVILRDKNEVWKAYLADCPKSIDFLSEPSRLHFKEVLEFFEILEIPYSIDHTLVGDSDIGSETIFSIIDADSDSKQLELAYGFRFNRLAKKIGFKKDLSCTALNISVKLKKNLKKTKVKKTKPQFYLIQFGLEAKLRSFVILRELYKAGVNVMHMIAKDKLSSQINIAENSGATHIILVGQKEALENSVVIRNNATRAQEIVPIPDLAIRAKKLV